MSKESNNVIVIEEIDLPGAELYYVKNVVDNPNSVYETLQKEIPWRQEKAIVFGKEYNQRRLTCFLGDEGKEYTYSGIKRTPEKMTSTLISLTKQVQSIVNSCREEEAPVSPNFLKHPLYTSVLANYYRDGNDNIGKHSDDEKDLSTDSIIASLSLGAERYFDIHCKKDGKKVMRLELENGSLLLMGKNMQKLYKHSVPIQKKIKDGRINLTWRVVKNVL